MEASLSSMTSTFQSTRPRRARRLRICRPADVTGVRFNPRARGGRDLSLKSIHTNLLVSIHAPAEGATKSLRSIGTTCRSFNPRARGGRDSKAIVTATGIVCFNPRARGGRDRSPPPLCPSQQPFQSTRPRRARPNQPVRDISTKGVSIHAPAEGATRRLTPKWQTVASFNPRARGGRDPARKVRPVSAWSFNPRARGGRDKAG